MVFYLKIQSGTFIVKNYTLEPSSGLKAHFLWQQFPWWWHRSLLVSLTASKYRLAFSLPTTTQWSCYNRKNTRYFWSVCSNNMSEFPGIPCIYTALARAGRISVGRKFYFNFPGRCCHYGEIICPVLLKNKILHFLFYLFSNNWLKIISLYGLATWCKM